VEKVGPRDADSLAPCRFAPPVRRQNPFTSASEPRDSASPARGKSYGKTTLPGASPILSCRVLSGAKWSGTVLPSRTVPPSLSRKSSRTAWPTSRRIPCAPSPSHRAGLSWKGNRAPRVRRQGQEALAHRIPVLPVLFGAQVHPARALSIRWRSRGATESCHLAEAATHACGSSLPPAFPFGHRAYDKPLSGRAAASFAVIPRITAPWRVRWRVGVTDISGILRLSPLTAPLALASSSTLFSSGRTGTRSSRSLAAKVGGQEPQKSAWGTPVRRPPIRSRR
jgi:hypothetical protein